MNRQFVCETNFAGLRPLGIGGRRIQESWHEIDAALRASLGAPYARLFAEPVAGKGATSWFAEPEGEPIIFTRLGKPAQQALIQTVKERSEVILAKVARLKASTRPADRRLGEALERALAVPSRQDGREFLYAIRTVGGDPDRPVIVDEPVLVNWGTRDDVPDPPLAVLEDFLRGEALRLPPPVPSPLSSLREGVPDQPADPEETEPPAEPVAGPIFDPLPPDPPPSEPQAAGPGPDVAQAPGPPDLAAVAQPDRPDPPEPPPAPQDERSEPAAPPRRSAWLWWLLLIALVAAIIAMLLPACGILVPFLAACEVTAEDLGSLKMRGQELETEVRALQQQAASLPRCELQAPRPLTPSAAPPPSSPERMSLPPVQGSAPATPAQRARIEQLDQAVLKAGGSVDTVAVTLQWQTAADLDLRVYCPNGSMIDFQLKGGPQPLCGRGRLDVDANVLDDEISAHPIENVSWPGQPPRGLYQIEVHHFKNRPPEAGSVAFTLRMRKGEEDRLIEGNILPGERRRMYEFSIP